MRLLTSRKFLRAIFLLPFLMAGCDLGYIAIERDAATNPTGGTGSGNANFILSISGNREISAGDCHQYRVKLLNADGTEAPALPSGSSYTIRVSGIVVKIFREMLCTDETTTLSLGSDNSGVFYVKGTEIGNLLLSANQTQVENDATLSVRVVAAAADSLKIASSKSVNTFQCVPAFVSVLDKFGNQASNHGGVTTTVSASGSSTTQLFSDPICKSPASSSFQFDSGQASKTLYVLAYTAGIADLNANAASLSPSQHQINVAAGSAPRIALEGPSGNVPTDRCTLVTAKTLTPSGAELVLINNLDVLISVLSGTSVGLFSNASCTTTLLANNVTIAAGTSQQSFYVKTPQGPQTVKLDGSAATYVSGMEDISFVPVAATIISLRGVPASLPASDCGQGQVHLVDGVGNPAFVARDTDVALSGSTPLDVLFYDSTNCSGAAVNTIRIAACANNLSCVNNRPFSFIARKTGSGLLTGSNFSYGPGQAPVTITNPSGTPFKVVLTRLTNPTRAGDCIKYRIHTEDSFGNLINVAPSNVDFLLTKSSGTGAFYDQNCSATISQVTIPAGNHEAFFAFKDTALGSVLLTATGQAPLSSLVAQDTVNIIPNQVGRLVFQGVPTTLPAQQCSPLTSLLQQDASGNSSLDLVAFNLIASNGVLFYSDPQCRNQVTNGQIAAGTSQFSPLYFKGTTPGAAVLTATATQPSGVIAANAPVTIGPAPDLRVAFSCDGVNFPAASCPSFVAGDCRQVFVGSLDNVGNLFLPNGVFIDVSLSSSSSNPQLFFKNAGCTDPVTGPITLAPTANPTSFYVKNTKAETFGVNGNPSLGASSSVTLTSTPGAASALKIAENVGPAGILNQSCAGPYRVSVLDSFSNDTTVAANTAVLFASSLFNNQAIGNFPNGPKFYSDVACSQNSVAINAGQGSADFYIRSDDVGNLSAKATASGLTASNARQIVISQTAKVNFLINGNTGVSHNFGQVTINQTSSIATVALRNISLVETAKVSSVTLPGAPMNIVSGGSCPSAPFDLAPGGSCTFRVQFAPTAVGVVQKFMTVAHHGSQSPQTRQSSFSFLGEGVLPLIIPPTLTPTILAFGSQAVGSSVVKTTTLRNPNTYPLRFNSISSVASPYSLDASQCGAVPFSLGAGASCEIKVTYNPQNNASHTDNFNLAYENVATGQNGNTASVNLTGLGRNVAVLTLNPTAVNFGNVAVNSDSGLRNIVVTNSGQVTAASIQVVGVAAPFTVSSGSCSTTLAPGQSCTLQAKYSPTTTGAQNGSFHLSYHNGASSQSSATVNLTGTGVNPGLLTLTPSTVNFGRVLVGSSSDNCEITVQNTGSVAVSAINIVGSSTVFRVTRGNCGTTLAAGASCKLHAVFTPNAAGSFSDNFQVSYQDGVSATRNATLALTGQGVAGANIQVATNSVNFGWYPIGSVLTHYVQIRNVGGSAASSVDVIGAVGGGAQGFFADRGTCGTTIPAGGSCHIRLGIRVIRFGMVSTYVVVRYQTEGQTKHSSHINLYGAGF